MPGGRLLRCRGTDNHLAERQEFFAKRLQARSIDAVVVRQKNAHAHSLGKKRSTPSIVAVDVDHFALGSINLARAAAGRGSVGSASCLAVFNDARASSTCPASASASPK